jgi:PAS domain S-box-containing protein
MIDDIEKFRIGIVGGGQRCKALLESIFREKDAAARPEILGVADTSDQAVGLQYAREKGLFTTDDYRELLTIEELELVLELTQDDELKQGIQAHKPPGVLVVDHYDALAILDAFRIKAKKIEVLEKLSTQDHMMTGCAVHVEDFYDYVMDINKAANDYGRQTRHRLVSSEQALSQIINGTTIPTFVIDGDHKVTHWNRACEKLTGYSAQKMVGTSNQWKPFRPEKRPTMSDLILDGVSMEDLWRQYGTRWEKSALIEGAYEVEEFFPHLGEKGTWLFFTAAPIKAPDGTFIGVIETLWDRTQRHEAEQALKLKTRELAQTVEELRANEQTMAQIINGSTIPTFVIDKSHRVTHWNRACEKLTGCKAEDMIGTTRQWTPFYEEERASMADLILDQVDELQIRQFYGTRWRPSVLIEGAYEAEVYFPDLGEGGKWCWFTAAPIRNPEGEVVAAIETLWDKTEDRKAAQEREQHTRELATYCSIYATLSGSLSLEGRIKAAIEEVANIFLLDGICIFIRSSDTLYHLRYSHGFSDSLCFHDRVADAESLVTRIAREGRVAVFQNPMEGGGHENAQEMELLQQEGFKSLVYIPILDKSKNALGVIRAGSHTAEHFGANETRSLELIANRIGVAIENAILEQENRQRANFQAKLIGSSNDGIVATDAQFRIVIFNPAAESIFGYSGSEVIESKTIRDIYPAQVVQAFEDAMAAMDADHWSLPWQESVILSKDGLEIPVRFSGSILHQKHKKMGIVTFFQDLREIKRLQKELVGAERLAAVGQTVAGMAHCVKNILHGLRGGSYMVNIGIDKDNTDKLKTGWNMVQRNIARTSDLVQDLLSYSKEREPEMAPCRPNEIVEEVCELMQAVAEENHVTLEMNLSPEIQEVQMDQRSLHRSLLNLVSNAIDACRDDPASGKSHHVEVITASDPDNFIRFDVRDNGSGMSAEVKSKLFSSLFSTKGPQGTGLGLLVTSKLVEEHKGTIQVESELTQGTTFSIRLPLIPV